MSREPLPHLFRTAVLTVIFAVVGTVSGVIGALLGAVLLARRTVVPAAKRESGVVVRRVDRSGSSVVAELTGPDVQLPGKYSFVFDDGSGHARLGDVREQHDGGVTRKVESVDYGTLRPGASGRITGWWFPDAEDLDYRVEHVQFDTELGAADGWIIHPKRARKRRWAVHVHGRGGLPQETLRGVAPLAKLGITSFVISYRNDPGAPSGEHGRYGLGISESRDVNAAIEEVVRRGAERVTLVGWSMGGTASLLAASDGEHRDHIDGIVLDSPALDWNSLLRYQAGLKRLPTPVTRLGISFLQRGSVVSGERDGIDFRCLTPEAFAKKLRVPVLIHASLSDTFVPSAGAERFAKLRPELVQLRLVETGEHVKIWNVDPDGWENATAQFVRWLPRPAWRG